ncbi:MAG: hypothetical protein ACJ780_02030 [Solirubrobacteraceae bacterium]
MSAIPRAQDKPAEAPARVRRVRRIAEYWLSTIPPEAGEASLPP